MNLAHLHLLLNHFPIIGTVVALGLFIVSFIGKNDDLKRSSLIIFAAIALLTLPAFFSGIGAQRAVRKDPLVSTAVIDRHEGAAMLALFFMLITGALALIELWKRRRIATEKPWSGTLLAILLFSLITAGLMARVGTTGGDIRHPEIWSVKDVTQETGLSALVHIFEPTPSKFTDLMLVSKYWWAFMMDLHFIGLALLIGTVGILNLRVLGFEKRLTGASLHRLMPWAMAGFGINVLTGTLAFIGMPSYYAFDAAFWLKILALLLLGLNAAVFYLTDAFESVERLGPGDEAPRLAKLVAGSSLFLWFAVITLGRYIQSYADTIR
ncbi:MAG TPA: hypothetical protein VEL77_01790 [Rugosimonospora sp.]|nr:hypothetical protein [Rugosimonospora sp.]